MNYIIIYNAETEFIKEYSLSGVKSQIASLIKDGYGADDIELYEADQKSIIIEKADITIKIGE